jgi:hypothetical protein
MKLKHFRLILNVKIDPQGETKEAIEDRMGRIVMDALNNGTLTGDSPSTVEWYDFKIKEIKP